MENFFCVFFIFDWLIFGMGFLVGFFGWVLRLLFVIYLVRIYIWRFLRRFLAVVCSCVICRWVYRYHQYMEMLFWLSREFILLLAILLALREAKRERHCSCLVLIHMSYEI